MEAFRTLPRARPEDQGMSSDKLEALRRAVRLTVDEGTKAEGFRPNALALVSRGGKIVFEDIYGYADLEKKVPLRPDSIFRMASCTKPVVAVAVMICYERGCFQLDDALSSYLPEFSKMQVWAGGDAEHPQLEPASQPITIRHLLTHTSGLQAAMHTPVAKEAAKVRDRITFGGGRIKDLAEYCKRIAACPLIAQPGTTFSYANGPTVLGRCVELWSGRRLDVFMEEHIFGPLGMVDTGFKIPEAKLYRLVEMYSRSGQGDRLERTHVKSPSSGGMFTTRGGIYDGAGGLLSTAADYFRFVQMLCSRGVGVNGARVLKAQTVELMSQNHLPGGGDIASCEYVLPTRRKGIPTAQFFIEEPREGVGHGLGGPVVVDAAAAKLAANRGQYMGAGAFNCVFYVDFEDELAALWMTQLGPDLAVGRNTMRAAVAASIVGRAGPASRL